MAKVELRKQMKYEIEMNVGRRKASPIWRKMVETMPAWLKSAYRPRITDPS